MIRYIPATTSKKPLILLEYTEKFFIPLELIMLSVMPIDNPAKKMSAQCPKA